MSKKIYIIIAVILGLAILATINWLRPVSIEHPLLVGDGVIFKLIDGDTNQPISNRKITICDDSIKYDRVQMPGEEYKGFCADQKVWGYATTDQEGKFVFDVKKINLMPSISIMIDPGKEYYAVGVERSDSLGHQYNPSYLRVLNSEKSGHVISNLFYNLDTKEVKEVFGSGVPDKIYAFDIINLTVFRIPKN